MVAPVSLQDAYSSIKAGLDMLKQPAAAASSADVPSKQALVQAAERIKAEAAKIGLMCSGSTPPEDQLLSLAGGLQQSCVGFCSLVAAASAAAGPSLRADLLKLSQGLTNPCLVLVKEMASGKDLKQHVGAVWSGVAAVSKAPADNKACMFQHLAGVLTVVKDTVRELEELQEQQQKQFGHHAAAADAPGAANSGGEGSDSASAAAGASANGTTGQQKAGAAEEEGEEEEDNDERSILRSLDPDLDYEAEEMSGLERQLLGSCLQLLHASAGVLKAFGKALLQGPALLAGSDALDSWESCLFHARHLRRQAEDLGAAMYPPQDMDEVASASSSVFTVAELMLDEAPDGDVLGQQLSGLAAQLGEAHERVEQLLATSEQAEQGAAAATAVEGAS